ncbi:MAG: hypothetical protein ACYCW6_26455 [Candidatus Xenobia bacterium]
MKEADLIEELKAESARLRALVDEARGVAERENCVLLDMATGLLKVRNVATTDVYIEHLDVELAGGPEALRLALSLASLTAAGGSVNSDALAGFGKIPPLVHRLRFRLSQELVERLMRANNPADAGVQELQIIFRAGNRMEVRGTTRSFVTLPFHVAGNVSLTPDRKMRFDIDNMQVGGFAGLPRVMQRLLLGFGGDGVSDNRVYRDGRTYIIDVLANVPPTLGLLVTRIETIEGGFILEAAGAPQPMQPLADLPPPPAPPAPPMMPPPPDELSQPSPP